MDWRVTVFGAGRVVRALMGPRILFHAVFTDAVHPNFHFVNSARKRILKGRGIDLETVRIQAIHLSAAFAIKMGMGLVVIIGRKAKIGGPSGGAQALDNTVIDQTVENAIDRDAVYGTCPAKGFINIRGRQRKTVIADDLQHA